MIRAPEISGNRSAIDKVSPSPVAACTARVFVRSDSTNRQVKTSLINKKEKKDEKPHGEEWS